MSYCIKNKDGYEETIRGVTVKVTWLDHGPFPSLEDAVDWWIDYNGGNVPPMGEATSIEVYEVEDPE